MKRQNSARAAGQVAESTRDTTMIVALIVRNAMEDFHHEHLSDDQMRELNPIIRNAIYTAVHSLATYELHEASRQYIDFARRMIPRYWEPPELLEDYIGVAELLEQRGA